MGVGTEAGGSIQRVASKALAMCRGILPGCHQYNVETNVVLRIVGVMSEPKLRDGDDPALAARGYGFRRIVGAFARLDLDKDQGTSAAGDDIDLAEGRFPAPRSDPVALGDEKYGGAAFRG
jgi:hypothetical protein